METKELHQLFTQHPAITTDSRNISPGCLFFALKGTSFNGNHFARQALEQGAAYAITDEDTGFHDHRIIKVNDVLTSLQQLSAFHRNQYKIPVIGITGTNGKTTTKELISAVLSKKYHIVSTVGNLNNHIGVPLTLLNLRGDTEIAIVEMGANHPGEIAELCQWVKPDYGIITNIGKAHLEGFGDIQTIIRTKNALYESVRTVAGTVFVNADYPVLMELSEGMNRITYGEHPLSRTVTRVVNMNPFLVMQLEQQNGSKPIHTKLIGKYNASNISAAIAVGLFFNVSVDQIAEALVGYTPSNNRSQVQETKHNTLILDAYNANPTSMEASIRNFSELESSHKLLILGDMLELGQTEEYEHQQIINLIKHLQFDKVILVGPVFHHINKDSHILTFHDSQEALEYLQRHNLSGNTILLKGSRGIHLEKLVPAL